MNIFYKKIFFSRKTSWTMKSELDCVHPLLPLDPHLTQTRVKIGTRMLKVNAISIPEQQHHLENPHLIILNKLT